MRPIKSYASASMQIDRINSADSQKLSGFGGWVAVRSVHAEMRWAPLIYCPTG